MNKRTIHFEKVRPDFLKKVEWYGVMETESMAPLIEKGDKIFISPVKLNKLKEGDIVSFFDKESERIIVHRLHTIDLKKNSFITKADLGCVFDKDSPQNIITGKVTKIKKSDGRKIEFSTHRGKVLNKAFFFLSEINYYFPTFQRLTCVTRKGLLRLIFNYD